MVELAGTVEEETEGGVVVEMPEGTNVGAKAARFRRSATVASPSLGGGVTAVGWSGMTGKWWGVHDNRCGEENGRRPDLSW